MPKPKTAKAKSKINSASSPATPEKPTLASLRADQQLWFKICVLIYDLRSLAKDQASEKRTLCTTDELYLSAPYFTPTEAAQIKATVVEHEVPSDPDSPEAGPAEANCAGNIAAGDTEQGEQAPEDIPPTDQSHTVEEAIKASLANFFEKRRTSGDSRPCGPHDMAPIYQRVFRVQLAEIQDERFLGRLRRSGLPVVP